MSHPVSMQPSYREMPHAALSVGLKRAMGHVVRRVVGESRVSALIAYC